MNRARLIVTAAGLIAGLVAAPAAIGQQPSGGLAAPVEAATEGAAPGQAEERQGDRATDEGSPIEDGAVSPRVDPKPARVSVRLRGNKGNEVKVTRRVTAAATVRPFVPGQVMKIGFYRKGKTVKRARKAIRRVEGKDAGRVKLRSKRFVKPGKYVARARHEATPEQTDGKGKSRRVKTKYPKLNQRDGGKEVRVFHRLLRGEGYGNAPGGGDFNAATSRAVHAFRKVNGMRRNSKATPDIYRKLAAGRGAFKLEYPTAGHHVEVDISRQVMVLANRGRAQFTYHISSGAPATPSDRGRFSFYRKDPGYNSIGMYYSVYYNRGEATHGYHSVPDYPASHGCIRNPIPDAVFIYNWIRLGDPIWVYG